MKAGATAVWLFQASANGTVIPLEDAPRGYADFDAGTSVKYILNPNGYIAA